MASARIEVHFIALVVTRVHHDQQPATKVEVFDPAREDECRSRRGKNRNLAHHRCAAVYRSKREGHQCSRLQFLRPGGAVSLQDYRIAGETHLYRFGRNRVAHDQLTASRSEIDDLTATLSRRQLTSDADISGEDLRPVQCGIHVGSLTTFQIIQGRAFSVAKYACPLIEEHCRTAASKHLEN